MTLGAAVGEGASGMHPVRGRNISESGIQVLADRLFAVHTRVLIEMEADEAPEGIQAVGTVVWVGPGGTSGRCILGIAFSDVGDTALFRIRSIRATRVPVC
jgi:Tfp pilus assembly protein PilZ